MPFSVADIVATTLRNRERAMGDAILNHNPILAKMLKMGRTKEVGGGYTIFEPLMLSENSTAQWYTNYQRFNVLTSSTLDVADGGPQVIADDFYDNPFDPGEQITASEFPWAQLGGFAAISGLEEIQNREKWQKVDLAEARVTVLEKTLQNNMAQELYGDGSTVNAIDGLQYLVADDPTAAGTPGGIDQVAYPNWQNQTSGNVTLDAATVLGEMNSMWLATLRGNDTVDCISANSVFYTAYWENVQQVQRVNTRGNAEKAEGYGYQALMFNGAELYYDANVPDGSGAGAVLLGRAYFINSSTLTLRYARDRRFSVGEKREIQDGDYSVIPVWFAGALTSNDRARNGVIFQNA